jgi:hypothetical protein
MNEIEQLTIERVDDIPILLAQLEGMQVASPLDRYFPTHGNWQGLSLGSALRGYVVSYHQKTTDRPNSNGF